MQEAASEEEASGSGGAAPAGGASERARRTRRGDDAGDDESARARVRGDEERPRAGERAWPLAAVLAPVAALAAWIPLALLSDGVHHDDEVTHYLFARWAWSDPRYLTDAWGRPGLTLLLAPFAPLGWVACRLVMGVASAATVVLAYAVARDAGLRGAVFAPWLLVAQPLFFVGGFTTLTETAAALYLAIATWAFGRGRLALSAAAISLVAVTRYEAVTLLVAWATGLSLRRAPWTAYAALVWAPLAHNLAGYALDGGWPWAILLAPKPTDHYGAGTPLTMIVRSTLAYGPLVAVLAGAGALSARALWTRATWMIPAGFGAFILTHAAIYWRGAYASGGYPRFFVTTAPLAAVLAAAWLGEARAPDRSARARRAGFAALAVVLALVAAGLPLERAVLPESYAALRRALPALSGALAALALAAGALALRFRPALARALAVAGALALAGALAPVVRPLSLGPLERDLAAAARWLAASPWREAPVVTANTWVGHFVDRGENLVPAVRPDFLDDARPGTVFVWDDGYALVPRFGPTTVEGLRARGGWRELWSAPAEPGAEPRARIFIREGDALAE